MQMEFRGTTVTFDAGQLADRKLDDTLDLTDLAPTIGIERTQEVRVGNSYHQRDPALLRGKR
jgi:hypothetical protein